MGIRVYTGSVCDKCGKTDIRDGAEGDIPPVGWAYMCLSWRADGAGWSAGGRRLEATLCPPCGKAVEELIIESPKEA